METFSVLQAPITYGFPSEKPVTRSFDIFFDVWWDTLLKQKVETQVN